MFFRMWCYILLLIFTHTCLADELIIEPDMGRTPILSAISHTQSSLNVVMYGMTDSAFIQELINAKNNGKEITILLEPHPYKNDHENDYAIKKFNDAQVNLCFSDPSHFSLTHQKTFLFDQQSALIMTFNLTDATFKKERNFALLVTNPTMLQEIQRVFRADCLHQPIAVETPDLIWSPNNSRAKIIEAIRDAKSTIKIYAQTLSDYQIIGEIAKAARAGIKVEILSSANPPGAPLPKQYVYLTKAGAIFHFNDKYIIHAKVIIIDDQYALVGSINLTKPSVNANRELSVITKDPIVIHELLATFNQDSLPSQ